VAGRRQVLWDAALPVDFPFRRVLWDAALPVDFPLCRVLWDAALPVDFPFRRVLWDAALPVDFPFRRVLWDAALPVDFPFRRVLWDAALPVDFPFRLLKPGRITVATRFVCELLVSAGGRAGRSAVGVQTVCGLRPPTVESDLSQNHLSKMFVPIAAFQVGESAGGG